MRDRKSGGSHPSIEDFSAFLRGHLPRSESSQVLHHWLEQCPQCEGTIEAALHTLETEDSKAEAYDGPLERAIEAARREELGERRRQLLVQDAVNELRRGVEPDLEEAHSARERIEIDLARGRELRYTSPRAMLKRIELAVVDGHCHLKPEECGGSALYHDLRCRIHIEHANALRVNDLFLSAQAELGKAFKHSALGTGDEALRAHLYRTQASLLGDHHYFELAQHVLDRAFDIYTRCTLAHLAGLTLVLKGHYFIEARKPQEAIAPLTRSLELLDPAIDPDLGLSARFNLAAAMTDCGEAREAKKTLWRLAQEFESRGQHLNSLRARWLEGKIHFALGDGERAARELAAARQGFQEAGQKFDAGLVALELAIVLRTLRRRREAREILAETRALFEVMEIDASVLLNLQIFEDIFRQRDTAARALFEMVTILRLAAAEAQRQERRAVERALQEEAGRRGW